MEKLETIEKKLTSKEVLLSSSLLPSEYDPMFSHSAIELGQEELKRSTDNIIHVSGIHKVFKDYP